VDRVELVAVGGEVGQGVALYELERIPRARDVIDADDVEPGPVIPDPRAALTTEQVE
jgi:hypothetical protein